VCQQPLDRPRELGGLDVRPPAARVASDGRERRLDVRVDRLRVDDQGGGEEAVAVGLDARNLLTGGCATMVG
jgi:hypothetical protein